MNSLDRSATLAQIVTEHPRAARVFQRHGMDYCCHGGVSVPEACRGVPLDPEAIFSELEEELGEIRERSGPEDDPRTLSRFGLIARIVDQHHAYARRAVPAIAPILARVVAVHGPREASLHELQATFAELSRTLLPHLDEEEEVLFPAILTLRAEPSVLERELERMEGDHLVVGGQLARMRALTGGYSAPEWGCRTYRVLMSELEAFEADTFRHVHLENHVLVPLATKVARHQDGPRV